MANLADIKIAIMSIKKTFKDSVKVKRIRKKCTKMRFLSVFPAITKIASFR